MMETSQRSDELEEETNFRVVFTDNVPERFDIEQNVLEGKNIELIDGESSTQEVGGLLKTADGVVSSHYNFDRELIEKMNRCKVISRRGIGVDYIDIEAASDNGILVANAPNYCVSEVSNHAMSLLLALQRRIVSQNSSVLKGKWDPYEHSISRLGSKVLGLVAFGNISRLLAERANSFGLEVVAYDPYLSEADVSDYDVSLIDFDELLSESDMISLHAPLTSETEGLIGMKELEEMKNTAYLVNTARGGLVDQEALVEALSEGKVAGAGLDVLQKEPPERTESLLELDEVIITPHMGHYSDDSTDELRRTMAENILSVATGRLPVNSVNDAAFED